MNHFKEKLRGDRPQIGTIITMGLPVVAEMISRCGFDWLWIDLEHSPLDLDQIQGFMQAKGDECAAFVRVPTNDEGWIKRVLDLGADGIIVPQVKTAEEARRAVNACKYPPEGIRSVGLSRAHGFGMDFDTYISEANRRIVVLLQVEHREGVGNIEEILRVPGIDAIIIGPYDLSGSFGKLGEVQDDEVRGAIETVRQACQHNKMPVGIFALSPEQGRAYLEHGYQLLAVGVDSHYLWTAAKSALQSVAAASASQSSV